MEKKPITALTAGMILLILNIVFSCVVYFGKFLENSLLQWFWYCVIIVSLIFFVFKFGKDNDNNVSFGSLFGYGFKITAFLILFNIAFSLVFFTIFPEIKDQIFEVAEKQAQNSRKGVDAEELKKGLEMAKKLFWVFTIGGILFLYGILGCIGSLIGAGIAKKNPRVFHEDSL